MRDAANILNTPAAMQIRYLETLSSMAKNGQGPKTIFMPLDASNRMTQNIGQPSGSK
jgi:erythrocyte band 7 integral membrane protein